MRGPAAFAIRRRRGCRRSGYPRSVNDPRPAISDTSDADLQAWLAARGEPAYRLRQIRRHAAHTAAAGWNELPDLPAGLRDALAAAFRWSGAAAGVEQA